MAIDRCHRPLPAILLGLLVTITFSAGCVPSPADKTIASPAPEIDWAKALRLGEVLFDLTNTYQITDEQLYAKYDTDATEVHLASTIFPGDTSPSRYMFIKEPGTGTQTVYLSGTNSQTMWQFNFDLISVYEPDLDAMVHRGFNNAALTVLDDLLPHMELGYKTTVAGFSLGGSMATLLAQYLIINGYLVVDVVTFGQPKVTNQEGAPSFANLPLLRFVNRNDVVPHLPPDDFVPPANLVHFGPEVILYDGPYYAYLEADDSDYLTSTSGDLLVITPLIFNNEHSNVYLARIRSKLAGAQQIPYLTQAP